MDDPSVIARALHQCAQEPIHTPGATQPHGVLLAFSGAPPLLTHFSENAADWLDVPAARLLGAPLERFFDPATVGRLLAACPAAGDVPVEPERLGEVAFGGRRCALLAHAHAGALVVELEVEAGGGAVGRTAPDDLAVLRATDAALRRVHASADLPALLQGLLEDARGLTGFDHLMIYRFDREWNGEVVAERCAAGPPRFLHLHFPAADIPAQARALYLHNRCRHIPDRGYAAVRLVSADGAAPLDLSYASLRSVSPVHLQYLANMGVAASLVASLVVRGRLWGLLACHHPSPARLGPSVRRAVGLLAAIASLRIAELSERASAVELERALRRQSLIVRALQDSGAELDAAATRADEELRAIVSADYGVLWSDEFALSFGRVPTGLGAERLTELARAVLALHHEPVSATDDLAGVTGQAEPGACGALAVDMDGNGRVGIAWFRNERVRDIAWGGNPDKAAALALDAEGEARLQPRRSFEIWRETVRGRSLPWSEDDVAAARLLLPLRDVLVARRAVRALGDSERRFRRLLLLSSEAWWETDATCRVTQLSRDLLRPHGLPAMAVQGRPLWELPGLAPDGEAGATLRRAVEQRMPFRDLEFTVNGPGEVRVALSMSGEPWLAPDGALRGFRGTLADVTLRHAVDEAVRRREAAERASREKTLFLSQMSHELRTPLNAILGFAQLLQAGGGTAEPAQQRRAVSQILSSGWHLLDLIAELLDMSRIEAGTLGLTLEVVPLPALVHEAAGLVREQARLMGVTIEVGIRPDDGPRVRADPRRLRQVLLNVLTNAIKYNRRPGRVDVRVLDDLDPEVVLVEIEDTGIGMSAAQLAALFEPFNRLGREVGQVEGTGLGLVITRSLVEAMGGAVSVVSTPDVGTTVRLRLKTAGGGSAAASRAALAVPVVPEPPAVRRSDPALQQPGVRLLLYVEDNLTNVRLMREMLTALSDWRLEVALSGAEALRRAADLRPDCVLLDLHLPDMHGLDVLREMRAMPGLADVPCIALSADATTAAAARARDAGCRDFIVKPFVFADLIGRLGAAMGAGGEERR